MGSALAKNEDVGVKQIEFVFVGENAGSVGLNVICFSGVFSLSAGVLGGGCALCRRVKRARLMSFKRAIFCWCRVPWSGEVVSFRVGGGWVVLWSEFRGVSSVGEVAGGVGGVVDVGDGVGSMYVGRHGIQLVELLRCGVWGSAGVRIGVRHVGVIVGELVGGGEVVLLVVSPR